MKSEAHMALPLSECGVVRDHEIEIIFLWVKEHFFRMYAIAYSAI